MTPKPLISVITPVWNGAHLIERCIKSVYEAMGHIPYEHLIIEGGSTDKTLKRATYVQCLEKEGNNVFIYPNRGKAIYPKWEIGIQEAKGEWIYMLGSDDRMQPGNHYLLEEMMKSKYDVLYGNLLTERFTGTNKFSQVRAMTGSISPLNYFVRKSILDGIISEKDRPFAEKGKLFNPTYTIDADLLITMRIFFDRTIKKKHLHIPFAVVADGGYSSTRRDANYDRDFYRIVLAHLRYAGGPGRRFYLWLRLLIKAYLRQYRMDANLYNQLNQQKAKALMNENGI